MKKIEIRKFTHAEVDALKETFGFLKIPIKHTLIRAEGENLEVSDGYHTFEELYDHRITLYIALCRVLKNDALHTGIWRSKRQSDGQICFGTGTMFALGIGKENDAQISYHIPIERWTETDFAETLEIAPKWDGHTSSDVIERLKVL